MTSCQSVAVFARYPTEGKVKTRLATTVGESTACSFYKTCTEAILRQLVKCEDTSVHLFLADIGEISFMQKWMEDLNLNIEVIGQAQVKNLGDRIFHALKSLKHRGYNKVAAVGTDIPDMTHTVVMKGLSLLDSYDMVMGPAEDGGFYFLGLKTFTKELFDDVAWSTETVYRKMVSNAEALHLSIAPSTALPTMTDIDTFQDLCLWTQLPDDDIERVVETASEKLISSICQ